MMPPEYKAAIESQLDPKNMPAHYTIKRVEDLPQEDRLSNTLGRFLMERHYEPVLSSLHIDLQEIRFYNERHNIPGAPRASEMDETDAIILMNFMQLHSMRGAWENIRRHVESERSGWLCMVNPALAHFQSKTDDRPSVFFGDCFPVGDDSVQRGQDSTTAKFLERLNVIFRDATGNSQKPLDFMRCPMQGRPYESFITSLCQVPELYMPLGNQMDSDFRTVRILAMLPGLGERGMRKYLETIGKNQEDEQALHYAGASREELDRAIMDARMLSGYPAALFWADAADLINCIDPDTDMVPIWVSKISIVHALKYIWLSEESGETWLHARRRGRQYDARINVDRLRGPMTDLGYNSPVLKNVIAVLGLPFGSIADDRTQLQIEILSGLVRLRPAMLPRQVECSDRPDVIAGPATAVISTTTRKYPTKFIDTGCAIVGCATMNMASGEVVVENIDGSDALTRITGSVFDEARFKTYMNTVPRMVPCESPAGLLFTAFRTIDDLGHPIGMRAVFDAIFIADQLRDDPSLIGTDLLEGLRKEYPMISVMPRWPEKDKTTNTGKSTIALTIARTFCPQVRLMVCSGSTSAPLMRTTLEDLRRYGAGMLDEFIVPKAPDHPLNANGIQSLCSGATAGIGVCGDTDPGITLRHSLLVATKFYHERPDIRNRMVTMHCNTFDATNKAGADLLAKIESGAFSLLLRLTTRRLINSGRLVEKIASLKAPTSNAWRWRHHYAIAIMLGGQKEVDAYLAAAHNQAAEHQAAVSQNGLAAEHNVGEGFSVLQQLAESGPGFHSTIALAAAKTGYISLMEFLAAFGYDNRNSKYNMIRGQTIDEIRRLTANGPVAIGTTIIKGLREGASRGKDRSRPMLVELEPLDKTVQERIKREILEN